MNVTGLGFPLCMDDTSDRSIARVAAVQHGAFTMAQADDAGFTRDQREWRTRTGRWEVVHPGVYRVAGTPPTLRGDVLTACLAAHQLAAASHRSAAEL